jgi:dsRNA-specific ribonuclease
MHNKGFIAIPLYETINKGKPHNQTFFSTCTISDIYNKKLYSTKGVCSKKISAEVQAAKAMLASMYPDKII